MNQELQRIENKKVGRSLTASDCSIGSRSSVVNEHTFQTDVVGSGASAALVSDSPRAINSLRDLSLLQVQDTLTKLHKLAPSYRRLMPQRPFSSFVPSACRKAILVQPGFLHEHKLQTDVVGSGASAALASDSPRAINSLRDLSLLQVQDTLTKLHKLAPSYRRLMPQRPFSSPLPIWN